MKKAFFAMLAVLTVFAMTMVSCGGGGGGTPFIPPTPCVITFDYNGGTNTDGGTSVDVQAYVGVAITLPTDTGLTGPTGKPVLSGWTEDEDGATTVYNPGGSYTPLGNVTLYAQWEAAAVGAKTPVVEEIKISNGWFTIFKFDLPAGAKWGDYEKITADYKVADVTTSVRARIFGNYTQKDIDLVRLWTYKKGDDSWPIAVLGSWPGGTSNRWIMYNKYGSAAAVSSLFAAFDPEDDAWFTVEYPELSSAANLFGDWDGGADTTQSLPGRKLDADSTGPLYLGVGLTTAGGVTDAMTYEQKKVVLVGKPGTPNVTATPVFFQKDGVKHRAYAGQLVDFIEETINTANGEPGWKILEGDDYTVIEAAKDYPDPITIKFDANYPTSDSKPAIADAELVPGDALPGSKLDGPAAPTTKPSGDFNGWNFDGWYTKSSTSDRGDKLTDKYLLYEEATIYAQWTAVNLSEITFVMGTGYAGTAKAKISITKGGGFTAAQLAIPSGGGVAGKVFGGWYTVDPAVSGFTYDDYDNLVKPTTKITTDDATLYAYWYALPADSTLTFNGMKVEALGGARIDEDGYVIFAAGSVNGIISANANDSLLSIKFPAGTDFTAGTSVKITYAAVKDIILPEITTEQVTDGWKKDAALIWKKAYNSWDSTTGGNYVSFTEAGGTLAKALSTLDATAAANIGVSIQINGGDDANNKQKRAGYAYGIKVTGIVIE